MHSSNDLYSIQEEHKSQEYASKWVCNFCGKAFYNENYLDKHFDNKHSDMLVKVKKKKKWLHVGGQFICNRCVFGSKNEIQLKMNFIFNFNFLYLQTLTIHHFKAEKHTKKAEFCNKSLQDHINFQRIFFWLHIVYVLQEGQQKWGQKIYGFLSFQMYKLLAFVCSIKVKFLGSHYVLKHFDVVYPRNEVLKLSC